MSRAKGDIAEKKAIEFLLSRGFRVIERNFYSRFGEIDIIATKNSILHFIEVKSAKEYELALQNITPTKIRRLIRTGDVYIKKNNYQGSFEYDALIVTPYSIEILENITL